jgi:hypothetical protein
MHQIVPEFVDEGIGQVNPMFEVGGNPLASYKHSWISNLYTILKGLFR